MPNRLLIVEREGKYTTSASAVLRSDQWRVETIDSVEDALAIIRIRAPQAVLIDANLGDRRTVDFVVEVGEMPEGRQVPIFVVAEPGTATDAGHLPKVTMLNAPLSAYSLKTALELAVAPSAADTGEPILSVEAFDSAFAGILAEPPSAPAPEASTKKGPSPQEMLLRDFPELAGAAVGAEPRAPFRAAPQVLPPQPSPQAPVTRAAAAPPERAEPAAPVIDWQMGEALLSREEEPEIQEAVPEVPDVEIREFEGAVDEVDKTTQPPPSPPEATTEMETFLFSLDEIASDEEDTGSHPMSRSAGASSEPRDPGVRAAEPEEESGFEPWSVPEPGAAAAFEDRTPVPPEGVGDEEFSVEPTSLSSNSTWATPATTPHSEAEVSGNGDQAGEAEWTWEETPLVEEAREPAPAPAGADQMENADWSENLVWEFGGEEESPVASSGPIPSAATVTDSERAEMARFEFTSLENGGTLREAPIGESAVGAEASRAGAGVFDPGVAAAPVRQQPDATESSEESLDDALVALEAFRPEFPLGAEPAPEEPSHAALPVDVTALRAETGPAQVEQSGEGNVAEPLLLDSEDDLWAVGPEATSVSSAGSSGRKAEGPATSEEIETMIRMRVQEAVMEMLPAVTERIVAETVEKMRHSADSD